jgi:hypothetical protein
VNQEILKNKTDFPTLYSKYSSGVLYKGKHENKTQNDSYVYFDYAFAHASLLTAKDAIKANKLHEAKSALKWVFEAIYISPDFFITKHDPKFRIDNLNHINSSGYSVILGFGLVSNVSG